MKVYYIDLVFGTIEVVPIIDDKEFNTIIIGNKRFIFDDLLPDKIDIRDNLNDDWQINVYSGIITYIEIIIDSKIYTGTARVYNPKTTELYFSKD